MRAAVAGAAPGGAADAAVATATGVSRRRRGARAGTAPVPPADASRGALRCERARTAGAAFEASARRRPCGAWWATRRSPGCAVAVSGVAAADAARRPRAASSTGATRVSNRCAGIATSPFGADSARWSSGGSMKLTKRRETCEAQPSVTLTATTGSSIRVVVVTRTLRRSGSLVGSSVTRTASDGSLASPAVTSAATHSRPSDSLASRWTSAAKSSRWPSAVVVALWPSRIAGTDGDAATSAMPRASRNEARCMQCNGGRNNSSIAGPPAAAPEPPHDATA